MKRGFLKASLILLLLCSVQAFANEAADGSSQTSVSSSQQKDSKFALSADLEYRSNLYAAGEYEKTTLLGLSAVPSYKLSDTYTVSASILLSQDLAGVGDTTLNNMSLKLSKKATPMGINLKWSPSLTAYLPTNEKARIDKRYYGGVATGIVLVTDSPVGGLDLTYGLSLKKDFHEFETDNLNRENVELSMANTLAISKSFGDKLSLSLTGVYQSGQTYRGTQKNLFILDESLSYQLNKAVSVAVGHTNEGNAFRYDGITSNIEVYDEETSTIYMSLSVKN